MNIPILAIMWLSAVALGASTFLLFTAPAFGDESRTPTTATDERVIATSVSTETSQRVCGIGENQ